MQKSNGVKKLLKEDYCLHAFVFSGGIHEISKLMPSDQTSTLKDPWINLKEKIIMIEPLWKQNNKKTIV